MSSPTQEIPLSTPALGSEGALCRSCGTPLAVDQRYCLECGTRRGDARVPFGMLPAGAAPAAAPAPEADTAVLAEAVVEPVHGRTLTPVMGALIAGAIGAAFGIGVLIGVVLSDDPAVQRAVVQRPPVVNVTVPTGGAVAGGAASAVAFTPDWPEGQDGYTVSLSTLTKDGTTPDQVAAAKTEASGAGAADVGALDSDEYASLDPGEYVIYSGVFDTRKQAKAALKGLREDYPDAAVVRVSSEEAASSSDDSPAAKKAKGDTQSKKELEEKANLSPEEFQKQSKKADKVSSEGKPPPVDKSKKPGGGTKAKEF